MFRVGTGRANPKRDAEARATLRAMSEMKREKCGAKKKNGERCKHDAGYGTDHPGYGPCRYHLGNTEAVRAASHKARIVEEMRDNYGEDVAWMEPHEALLEEVRRTAGHVYWLRDKIREMDDSDLWQYSKHDEHGSRYYATRSVWLELYQQERAHLVRVSKTAIDAGVAERAVRVAEKQAQLLASAISNILNDLGVSNDPRAPEIVRRELVALAGPGAA